MLLIFINSSLADATVKIVKLVSLAFTFPLPLKMGAAIFALTDTVETAADLAARSGGKQELVQLLRAVEGKEMTCGDTCAACYAVAF